MKLMTLFFLIYSSQAFSAFEFCHRENEYKVIVHAGKGLQAYCAKRDSQIYFVPVRDKPIITYKEMHGRVFPVSKEIAGQDGIERYSYDKKGNLIKIDSPWRGKVHFQYDDKGKVIGCNVDGKKQAPLYCEAYDTLIPKYAYLKPDIGINQSGKVVCHYDATGNIDKEKMCQHRILGETVTKEEAINIYKRESKIKSIADAMKKEMESRSSSQK